MEARLAIADAPTPAPPVAPAPDSGLPPEAHLAMPTQSFRHWGRSEKRAHLTEASNRRPWLTRLLVFGGAIALTLYGVREMIAVVSVGSTTFLQYVLVALFTVNFSWIALAFTSALAGGAGMVAQRWFRKPTPEPLRKRTAILMPVYNEETARVFANLQAIRESADATGQGHAFDYFVLSDSTRPDAWIAEERAFLAMRARLGEDHRFYYRHRPKNTHRKAGNIADFVRRWGGAYEHMVVLDADSLMTGECILRLTRAMEADPDSGIVQSLPLIINRNTLFARLQQFAAKVYGPVIATGLSMWSGRDGNYWGHNAIIRVKAFAAHAGLPDLSGKPPFGGHILSHDFVEAALILRAGWTVYMLPDATGSYEESPPTLIDLAVRDRRWCQGNLQHSRVIGAKGLTLPTRQHFATGIMSYLASPFWLGQLLVGVVLVLQTQYVRPEYFTTEFTLFPAWPRFDPERALSLFELTMAILIAPKIFGLLLTMFDGRMRRTCGGSFRLLISGVIEIILSALIAPLMMLIQSESVFQILLGRDSGWNPQRRGDGTIPFKDIVRRHRMHMALGFVTAIAAFMISTSLFLWMSPTILGLVLAIPLSFISGTLTAGLALRRLGLLRTPEESNPPEIVIRANALARELARDEFDDADGLAALHADRALMAAHEAMLPKGAPRKRGDIQADRAVAIAKLTDAHTLQEALSWLKPQERMIVLNDRALLALIGSLPDQSEHQAA
ncbi:glucans biosynthesis glucosyltransferase MdoH [Terrarubrum flagellatum]|uniref:glucans biosynthesis glucosyltransferase MdoH n=1 Tax=Terrirubrum flagellatum TaxID=2895980 RepID=UPI0031455ED9